MERTCMIAVLDILGFSLLIENNKDNLVSVSENVCGFIRQALDHSIRKEDFPKNKPSLFDVNDQEEIGIAWFSDTLLLYAKKNTDDDVRNFLVTMSWFMFETMLTPSSRFRGGIAYGKTYIDEKNSIFMGQPIISAYKMETWQAWAGAALTNSAVERVPDNIKSNDGHCFSWGIVRYDVPIKGGPPINTFAIDWTRGAHVPGALDFRWSKDKEYPTEEDYKNNQSRCDKFVNTKLFHQKICRFCKR